MTTRGWAALAVAGLLVAGLVVEVAVLVVVGNLIGLPATLGLLVLASLLGMVLLRREGLRAWRGFRQAAADGGPPGQRVTDGVVGLAGAFLLAVPGLLSAVVGGLLLIPPVRALARGRLRRYAERRLSSAEAGALFGPRRVRVRRAAEPDPTTDVVEGEIVDGPVRPGRDAP
jgi:UPF0716 protein FxsA